MLLRRYELHSRGFSPCDATDGGDSPEIGLYDTAVLVKVIAAQSIVHGSHQSRFFRCLHQTESRASSLDQQANWVAVKAH
ncbi:hypothetical protein D3C85_1466510 [compost metagenome]